MTHIIWDWNGTLLHDLPVILDAVNAATTRLGLRSVSLDDYRTHYTRPVKVFYEKIAERSIDDDEWLRIDRYFHERYHATVVHAELAAGAHEALTAIEESHHSQSLLSMAPHDELSKWTAFFGVAHYFSDIQGSTGSPGGKKSAHLRLHLDRLDGAHDRAVMVGDTVDDAHAAQEHGLDCVLYYDGSHHLGDLEAIGVPITDSLVEAVEIALGF